MLVRVGDRTHRHCHCDQGARAAKWSSVGLLCTRMDFVDRMSVASLLSRRLAAVCLPCFKRCVCALGAAVCAQCAVDRVSCHNPVCWRASLPHGSGLHRVEPAPMMSRCCRDKPGSRVSRHAQEARWDASRGPCQLPGNPCGHSAVAAMQLHVTSLHTYDLISW